MRVDSLSSPLSMSTRFPWLIFALCLVIILINAGVAFHHYIVYVGIEHSTAHSSAGQKAARIPWEEFISSPGKYYDNSVLKVQLDHPQNLSTLQVLTLTQELLATSGTDSAAPFHFFDAEKPSPPGPTELMTPAPQPLSKVNSLSPKPPTLQLPDQTVQSPLHPERSTSPSPPPKKDRKRKAIDSR